MFQWAVKNQLARGGRPGYTGEGRKRVRCEEVDKWISEAKIFGVRSVICLLADDQLSLYADLPVDLVNYYRRSGLTVEHIPVPDYQRPPLSANELERAYKAYAQLPKPVLVQCSAGKDRTGRTVEYIERQRENEASKTRSKE